MFRMKDGLLSIVTAAGAISAALVWSVSAHDPYWRLFEAQSVPAPAYSSSDEALSHLERVLLQEGAGIVLAEASGIGLRNVDTGATRGMAAAAPIGDTVAREAEAPAQPKPLIAIVPGLDARAGTVAWAPGHLPAQSGSREAPDDVSLPRLAAGDSPGLAPSDIAILFQPTPGPEALREHETLAAIESKTDRTLDPFAAPSAPAQPRTEANSASEERLGLDRAGRMDVQRRLALAGFRVNGIDGVFGDKTRDAIADFQTAWGFPATGYLDRSVMTELNQRTDEAYAALRHRAETEPKAAPGLAPATTETELASEDSGSCARHTNGQIIEGQGLLCDVTGLTEKIVSFGSNRLSFEGDVESMEPDAIARGRVPDPATDR